MDHLSLGRSYLVVEASCYIGIDNDYLHKFHGSPSVENNSAAKFSRVAAKINLAENISQQRCSEKSWHFLLSIYIYYIYICDPITFSKYPNTEWLLVWSHRLIRIGYDVHIMGSGMRKVLMNDFMQYCREARVKHGYAEIHSKTDVFPLTLELVGYNK